MIRFQVVFFTLFSLMTATIFAVDNVANTNNVVSTDNVINVGSRRELFIDDYLVAAMDHVELQVHQPERKELSLIFDQPWEGDAQNYFTVFYDNVKYRMYYHAWGQFPSLPLTIGYAESNDGIHWVRPKLGFCDFKGSKENNIIMDRVGEGISSHDFNPFWDKKPGTPKDAKYKAVGFGYSADGSKNGLYAWKSPDAVHWTLFQQTPVFTNAPFDTQNVAFWSEQEGCYVLYYRHFRNVVNEKTGTRIVLKAVSDDFIHWKEQGEIKFHEGEGPRFDAQFYTNQIMPYYRAPHLYIGFPARYVDHGITESTKLLPEWEARQNRIKVNQRLGTTVTDSVFISSRDGLNFRESNDVFVRPGLRMRHNWCYGDNYLAWSVVETNSVDDDSPRELSIYSVESYQTGGESRLRRYALRIDGFSSLHAKSKEGCVTTKPIQFIGKELSINAATSAAGSIRVEVCTPDGKPLPNFSADDCDLIYGDSLDRRVSWKGNTDMSKWEGKTILLRFIMREADIYSMKWETAK